MFTEYNYVYIVIFVVLLTIILYLYFCSSYLEHFVPFEALTDFKDIKDLNLLMKKTNDILNKNQIGYWICAGTLLGAVRDKGIIPWDDDADICIMESDVHKLLALKEQLKQNGIGITEWMAGYKLYDLKGRIIDGKDFLYPFVDIFVCKIHGSKILYRSEYATALWPNEYFYLSEIYPLKLYDFEDYQLWGPDNPYAYLDRDYPNWRNNAEKTYDHTTHKKIEKISFKIEYNKNNKPYLWQYWDNIDGKETPPYISLCLKTVDRNCSDSFNVVRLNKNNIFNYIPELKEYESTMNDLIIAHKVDIYRIILLYKYGGLYMDADTICLRDPIEIMDKLKKYEFVGFGCTGTNCTNGYSKPSNWILASRPNSTLMGKCAKTILNKITKTKNYNYHDLGKMIIWEELDDLIKKHDYEYYHYENKIDGSRDRTGNWINTEIVFSNKPIDYVDEDNMLFYVFYNSGITDDIKKMSETELLSKDWNYTKYLKKGLGNSKI